MKLTDEQVEGLARAGYEVRREKRLLDGKDLPFWNALGWHRQFAEVAAARAVAERVLQMKADAEVQG